MLNVYYPTGVLLVLPLADALSGYWKAWPARDFRQMAALFGANLVFLLTLVVALLPTLVTRQLIFGHPLRTGNLDVREWNWTRPALWEVLFSANHGLLSWTPIVGFAIAGLWLLRRKDKPLSGALCLAFLAYYYTIAAYEHWHGMASFGNRFFISLVPLFVLGLAAAADRAAGWFATERHAFTAQAAVVALLVLWNAGFIFQWGTRMIPVRGPVVWSEVARNQVTKVPARLWATLRAYTTGRRELMQQIEAHDLPSRAPDTTSPRSPE
jgi:hypothetical protein